MNRQVVVIREVQASRPTELLESLSEAGISLLEMDFDDLQREASLDPAYGGRDPLALIYEVRPDSNHAELSLVIDRASASWPSVPIVACRCETTERIARRRDSPDDEELKRLGFRAIADSPAQLPAVLRQVEETLSTGELRLPQRFKRVPESHAFSLAASLNKEHLRGAFALLSSLHLALNQKEAAQAALAGLGRLINADRWSIFLMSQTSGTHTPTFTPIASRTFSTAVLAFDEEWWRELFVDPTQPGEAETTVTREAAGKIETIRGIDTGRHIIALPMISDDRVLGVLEGIRSRAVSRSFSRSEVSLLESLSISIAAALANSVRIADAERLSLTDDLTRLHNARYLRQFLVNEIKRARRYNSSVTAVFLDLDDFKLVNDAHGHLAGSHVLMEVAALLLPSVRDTDCVVRYGGDEFLLILPDARVDHGMQVAERIRAKIERHRFHGGRRLQISLTASLGVAAFPQHALSPQQLITWADRAMYQAKAANKNCIKVASDAALPDESVIRDASMALPAQFQRIPDDKLIS